MNSIDELKKVIADAISLQQKFDIPPRFNKHIGNTTSKTPHTYKFMLGDFPDEIHEAFKYDQSLHKDIIEWKKNTLNFLNRTGFESTSLIIDRYYNELSKSFSFNLKARSTFMEQAISTLLNLCEQIELVQVKSDVLPIIKPKKSRPHKQRPETLLEIWEPDNSGLKDEYNRQIEKLKKFNPVIDIELLSEKNEKLFWNPKRPSLSYLVGFIYTCIQKKWIKKGYSAPLLLSVLNNTFNIKMKSSTPFKGIDEYPPKEKYYQVFRNIPTNV